MHLPAVHDRHVEIEQDKSWTLGPIKVVQTLPTIGSTGDLIALPLQYHLDSSLHHRAVVDEQDVCGAHVFTGCQRDGERPVEWATSNLAFGDGWFYPVTT